MWRISRLSRSSLQMTGLIIDHNHPFRVELTLARPIVVSGGDEADTLKADRFSYIE